MIHPMRRFHKTITMAPSRLRLRWFSFREEVMRVFKQNQHE